MSVDRIDVYLEMGQKKIFACAIDWPGWSRSGRDEEAALQALLEYAPRYAQALNAESFGFHPPAAGFNFDVIERLEGDAATDMGTPRMPPAADSRPVSDDEVCRLQDFLRACWQYFDTAARHAAGHELRKGPRGGGRDLDVMIRHVMDAERAYLASLGGKAPQTGSLDLDREAERLAALDTLLASAHGEISLIGPRGGKRWSPRYFTRRAAWHLLDHAWEIEDRIESIS